MKQYLYLALFFLISNAGGYAYEEAIGIVNFVEGALICREIGQSYCYPVDRKMPLSRNITIEYAEWYKKRDGKLQIIIKNGEPRVFTAFPLNLAKVFSPDLIITQKEREELAQFIGGSKVLSSEGDPTFQWFCEPGNLDEETANELKIIISPYKKSPQKQSITPLFFQLKKGVKLKRIDCTLWELNERDEPVAGSEIAVRWKQILFTWRLNFTELKHLPGRKYRLNLSLEQQNGRVERKEFDYKIIKAEELEELKQRALEELEAGSSEYDESRAILKLYDDRTLKLPAAKLRKKLGLIVRDY